MKVFSSMTLLSFTPIINSQLLIINCFSSIQFHLQVIDNKFLAFLCVLAHVIFQQMLNMIAMFKNHRLQPNIIADKATKFIRLKFHPIL